MLIGQQQVDSGLEMPPEQAETIGLLLQDSVANLDDATESVSLTVIDNGGYVLVRQWDAAIQNWCLEVFVDEEGWMFVRNEDAPPC